MSPIYENRIIKRRPDIDKNRDLNTPYLIINQLIKLLKNERRRKIIAYMYYNPNPLYFEQIRASIKEKPKKNISTQRFAMLPNEQRLSSKREKELYERRMEELYEVKDIKSDDEVYVEFKPVNKEKQMSVSSLYNHLEKLISNKLVYKSSEKPTRYELTEFTRYLIVLIEAYKAQDFIEYRNDAFRTTYENLLQESKKEIKNRPNRGVVY